MKKMILAFLICFSIIFSVQAEDQRSRNLEFDYEVVFKDIPEGASELKVWLPVLRETDYQMVKEMEIKSESFTSIAEDQIYGNKILNFTLKSPFNNEDSIKVHYKVKRLEYARQLDMSKNGFQALEPSEQVDKFLNINRLGKLTPEYEKVALEITKGKQTTLEKARAIYDYIFENVAYNKELPGWGNGDTARVCSLKAGNCTDFHSLFISMSRANNIPAKFVVGVPFKPDVTEGQVPGYHCWAEFYDTQLGWVPVDISEAWKDKSKYEYHFGAVDENRIEFSQGRDIVLQPQQSGDPLNYFVYPYAELDGKVFKGVGVLFKFKDVEESEEELNRSLTKK